MSDIQNEEKIIDLDNLFRVKVAVDSCNNDINKYQTKFFEIGENDAKEDMDLADYGEKLLKNVSFLLDLLSNDNLEIKEIDDNNIISIINENNEEEKIDINDIINIFSYIKNHYEDVGMYHFTNEFNEENELSLINNYRKFVEKIPEIYKENEKIAEINSIMVDLNNLYKIKIDNDLYTTNNKENLKDNVDNDFYIVTEEDIKDYVPEENKFNKKPSLTQRIKNFFKKLFNVENREEETKEINNYSIFNEASNSNTQSENNIRQQRRQEFEKNTQQNKEQGTESLHI